jgi:hypothetical protein
MPTRIISFAGNSLALDYEGKAAAEIIDILYRHLPADPTFDPHLTYCLISGQSSPQLRLWREDVSLYHGQNRAVAAELLLGDSCYHLAAHSQNGLLFHAAALSWQGQGLILPGVSGSGKTTLTAWLLGQGFDYLTDELVFIPWQTNSIQTFTRPLNLKRPARTVLQNQIDWARHEGQLLSSDTADLVPPHLLTQTDPAGQANLGLVIFPRYRSDAPFELRPLSKAQTGLALMQNLINARNLPQHGFSEVARLTTHAISAYQLTYADFAQIERHLDHFIDLLTT